MTARQVQNIEYELLEGAQRATTDIVIERNGKITVRAPKGFTPEQVDAVVQSKRMWIYRNLAEWTDLNASAVVREWVNGEAFLYLGSSYRLSLVSHQSEPLLLRDGRFCLQRQLIESGGTAAARSAFEAYYIEKGHQRVAQRVAYYSQKVGVQPGEIRVKDMGYRWASCGQNGSLNFHWKCMMAPARIIDYIVVHELCHLHRRNHDDSYWNEVDKVMPDYRERKEWLRRCGAGLSI